MLPTGKPSPMSAGAIDLNVGPEADDNSGFPDSNVSGPFLSDDVTAPADGGFAVEFEFAIEAEGDYEFHGSCDGVGVDVSVGAFSRTSGGTVDNVPTDSFESRGRHAVGGNLNFESDVLGFDYDLEIELGFDLGAGHRVLDLNSEPDSEEFEVNLDSVNNNSSNNSNGTSYHRAPIVIDFLGIGDGNINHHESEEAPEWEEAIERIILDESEAEGNEELQGPSEFMNIDLESDENDNSMNIYMDLNEGDENANGFFDPIDNPDDHVLSMDEYAFFEHFVVAENENPRSANPPAAKRVVESLPTMVLKREDMAGNGGGGGAGGGMVVVCSICNDEAVADDEVTRMPCLHSYHRQCIEHWLSIRNTCPVCRYELTTDDQDYETTKGLRRRDSP